jgi:protease-4
MDQQASTGVPPDSGSGFSSTFGSTPPPASATPPPPTVPPVINMGGTPPPPPPPRRGGCTGWKILAIVCMVLLAIIFVAKLASFGSRIGRGRQTYERVQKVEEVTIEQSSSQNKIAVIGVEGIIMSAGQRGESMPEFIREQLKAARADRDVKAVILKINSPGGEVLAADEINAAIKEFEEKAPNKPVVASMGSLAASGGYYVAAPCRWIVANELTITGSIGVIMHGYNYRGLMNKLGIKPDIFKSGKFKDMLSGDQEPDLNKLSEEEKATRIEERRMVQDLIDETFNRFKEVVKTGRAYSEKRNNGKGKSLAENWADYADGRVFSGKQALQLGFVDETGNFEVAVKRAKAMAGIDGGANLIEYRRPFDLSSLFGLFGKAETPSMKVDLGINIPKLQAGQLYYIFPGVLN